MEALGLLDKIEPHTHMVPHGDRSGVVIEPYLTDQWYVDAKTLAQPAIAAVRDGPHHVRAARHWETTYFDWMENIQPWCISRQLWWGHQIPAWYGWALDGDSLRSRRRGVRCRDRSRGAGSRRENYYKTRRRSLVGSSTRASTRRLERRALPDKVPVWRDEDVLDTWFSSALWPFSTLGWPDETPELKRYYPTNVLVTGFDIIFFWVARMMMMGLHFMKEVPFHTVYIHALVRDERGAKMSKSKGNVIDPLELIDEYGADALRFTLAAMAAQGRDIKLSTQRVEGYRNFATKLWNAARFAEMNGCVTRRRVSIRARAKETLNRWIAHETAEGGARGHRGDRGLSASTTPPTRLYRFVWNIFCDWYLELAKPVLTGAGRRGQGRDARDDRLGARRDPQAAASVHAVHHRGAVARHRRAGPDARQRCWRSRLAAA